MDLLATRMVDATIGTRAVYSFSHSLCQKRTLSTIFRRVGFMPTIASHPLLEAMIEAELPRKSYLSSLFSGSGGHKAHPTDLLADLAH